jgi:hypothetical protein
MEIKCNQLEWKAALAAGLFLNCGIMLEASIPYFSGWKDRTKLDARIAIGSTIASIDKKNDVINSYLMAKSYNPNQKVMIGYLVPIIFLAACLPTPSSGDHPLKKLLENNDTVVAAETALGDTPLHAAAMNSADALELLLADGRLDINEANNDGKTPLYMAMECNEKGSHAPAIRLITSSNRFLVNSRDNRGRTMLHIAVAEGNLPVVEQILALRDGTDEEPLRPLPLNPNIVDEKGRTPADYLGDIEDVKTRMYIQNALAGAGAEYGRDGQHIALFDSSTGDLEYEDHVAGVDSAVEMVNGFPSSPSPS